MTYILTGIAKNGRRIKASRPTSGNAKILKGVWVDKGVKKIKIKYEEPRKINVKKPHVKKRNK